MVDWTYRIGRRIKLRDLHILLAVAKSGSMGKAAAQLAISQPVISKAISDLEYEVGVPLLDRGPQGVEPTAHGRALLKCGIAVFDDLRLGVKELEFLSDPAAGELRIGCTEAGATGFVPAVIDRLSRKFARVTFHVLTADAAALTARELPERNIELAIGATPGHTPGTEIETEVLFNDRQVVMAGAKSKWVRARISHLANWRTNDGYFLLLTALRASTLRKPFVRAGCHRPSLASSHSQCLSPTTFWHPATTCRCSRWRWLVSRSTCR